MVLKFLSKAFFDLKGKVCLRRKGNSSGEQTWTLPLKWAKVHFLQKTPLETAKVQREKTYLYSSQTLKRLWMFFQKCFFVRKKRKWTLRRLAWKPVRVPLRTTMNSESHPEEKPMHLQTVSWLHLQGLFVLHRLMIDNVTTSLPMSCFFWTRA